MRRGSDDALVELVAALANETLRARPGLHLGSQSLEAMEHTEHIRVRAVRRQVIAKDALGGGVDVLIAACSFTGDPLIRVGPRASPFAASSP